jgi:hypothetical protein
MSRASSRSKRLSVGQFFAAAIIPGLMLVVLYLLYILMRGAVRVRRTCRPRHSTLPKARPAGNPGRHRPSGAADLRGSGRHPRRCRHPDRSRRCRRHRRTADGGHPGWQEPSPYPLRHRGSRPPWAILAGLFPVRLQRNDLEFVSLAAGGLYIVADHRRLGGDHRGALRDDPHTQSSWRGRFNAHHDRDDLRHHPGSGHVLAGLYRPGRRGAGLPYPHQHARRSPLARCCSAWLSSSCLDSFSISSRSR